MFVAHRHAWENGSSFFVFFRELVVDLKSCLEQIFKQFEFLWLPVKVRIVVVRDLGNFENMLMLFSKIGRITVTRQLLKGKQNLVCFNCCMGLFTAKLWLNCGARLLSLPWRCSTRAARNLFLNSCQHVMCLFLLLIINITGVTGKNATSGEGSSGELSPAVSQFSE